MTTPDTDDDVGEDAGERERTEEDPASDAGETDGASDADETGGAGDNEGTSGTGDAGGTSGTGDAGGASGTGDDGGTSETGDARGAGDVDEADAEQSVDTSAAVAAEAGLSDLTGPPRTLDPRIRYVWVAQSVTVAAVLGVVGGAIGLAVNYGPLVGVAVFVVVAALGVGHSVLRYRSWCYQVRGDSLYLERGVFTHVTTVVPYVRIQHVDASRGPLERLVGLATSVVYTAGSRGADVTIPGLTPERSEELQARLKQLAIAAEGDDAV